MGDIVKQKISTEELSQILGVKPGSIRSALCLNGHYWGLRPVKMPNRLLLWDREQVEALLSGERAA